MSHVQYKHNHFIRSQILSNIWLIQILMTLILLWLFLKIHHHVVLSKIPGHQSNGIVIKFYTNACVPLRMTSGNAGDPLATHQEFLEHLFQDKCTFLGFPYLISVWFFYWPIQTKHPWTHKAALPIHLQTILFSSWLIDSDPLCYFPQVLTFSLTTMIGKWEKEQRQTQWCALT